MKTVVLRQKEAIERGAFDVVVVGGGPAGCAAADAAAGTGAKTLLIERGGCLGGVATAGGHAHITLFCEYWKHRQTVGGFARRLANLGTAQGWGETNHSEFNFEIEYLKLALERELLAKNVHLLYYSDFVETVIQEGNAAGVIVHNKGGLEYYEAKTVIDCTGDGDVAASAGAEFEMGRESDHRCQPVTLMFTVDQIDYPKICAWRTNYHMQSVFLEARRNGDLGDFQSVIHGFWHTRTRPDALGINFTNQTGVDGLDPVQLTRATTVCREQIQQSLAVFRKYVPGMEHARLVESAEVLGVRETRRICCDYMLSTEEVQQECRFPDSIGYGSFLMDVHGIDADGMDGTTWHPEPGFRYQIPYRSLLPRGIGQLLVAGRCIGVSHLVLSSVRVMANCMATGEAAGAAAALALQKNVPPRQLDPKLLQMLLRSRGAIVTEEDIWEYSPGYLCKQDSAKG